jgi:O-antigen/teichoic acid export membrane protein
MDDGDAGISSLANQAGLNFVGKILGRALEFALVLVITRLASPTAYGIFTLAMSVVLFARGISSLNIHSAVDYFVPKFLSDDQLGKAKGALLDMVTLAGVSTLLGAAVVFAARGLLSDLFSEPNLAVVLPLLVLLIPLETAKQILLSVFNSIQRQDYRLLVEQLVGPVARILLVGAFLLAGAGLFGLVSGYLLGLFVAVAVGTLIVVRRVEWLRTTSAVSVSRRSLLSYSVPLIFAGIGYTLVAQIDYFVIGYFMPSSAVGRYRVGYLLGVNVYLFYTAVSLVFKPTVPGLSDDPDELLSRYQAAVRWILLLSLPVGGTLVIAPDVYLSVLFGTEYLPAAAAVVAITLGYVVNSSFGPTGAVLEGLAYTRLQSINAAVLLVSNVALDVLLVPQFGILGAALGTASSFVVYGFAGVLEVYFLRGIVPYTTQLVPVCLASVPALVVGVLFVRLVSETILVAVVLPVLVVSLFVVSLRTLNGFTEDDLTVARGVDSRLGYPLVERFIIGHSR